MLIIDNVKTIAELTDILSKLIMHLEHLDFMLNGEDPAIIMIAGELDSAADEVASLRKGGLPGDVVVALIQLLKRVLPFIDGDGTTFTRKRVLRLIVDLENATAPLNV